MHEIDEVVEMDSNTEPAQKLQNLGSRSTIIHRESQFHKSLDGNLFEGFRHDKSAATTLGGSSEGQQNSFLAHARLNNVLQIKTTADGLSSGRTYYVSTHSNANATEARQALAKQLSLHAKIARRKAEAKSRFERSQEKVKAIQCSAAFQLCMAALIMAVSQTQSPADSAVRPRQNQR